MRTTIVAKKRPKSVANYSSSEKKPRRKKATRDMERARIVRPGANTAAPPMPKNSELIPATTPRITSFAAVATVMTPRARP